MRLTIPFKKIFYFQYFAQPIRNEKIAVSQLRETAIDANLICLIFYLVSNLTANLNPISNAWHSINYV